MRRLGESAAFVLFLVLLGSRVVAAQGPIPISECGTITRPGNYVFTNDVILDTSDYNYDDFGQGGNCLTIDAAQVNINMNGWAIGIACPPLGFSYCPSAFGVPGGIAIEVTAKANHVSISNGSTDGFVYGMVVEGASHLSVTDLDLRAVVGLTLENATHGTFTNVSMIAGDTSYHGSNGPVLYMHGGNHNIFSNLGGFGLGDDLGSGPSGIEIENSSYNSVSGANIEDTSCGNADVLLTNSSFNTITNGSIFDECGSGIEIDEASQHNSVSGNTVSIASPTDEFAMVDQNPDCGTDIWTNNVFSNDFAADQISASPANCIK